MIDGHRFTCRGEWKLTHTIFNPFFFYLSLSHANARHLGLAISAARKNFNSLGLAVVKHTIDRLNGLKCTDMSKPGWANYIAEA